jgi:hypothetical protein
VKKQLLKQFLMFCTMLALCIFPIACGSGGSGSDSTDSSTNTSTSTDTTDDDSTVSVDKILISAENYNIEASNSSSTQISAQVKDKNYNLMYDVEVTFSTSKGSIGQPVRTNTQGIAVVTLFAEESSSDLVADVRAYAGGVYSDYIHVTFTATKRYVTGRAYDTFGRPIANATVSAFSDYTQNVVTDENGYYQMWLPEGGHTVVISHPDYAESYQSVEISEDDKQIQSDGLLIASNVSPKGHSFDDVNKFYSNIIENRGRATLIIPQQSPITITVNNQQVTSADIAIEYFEAEQILPVPLPDASNYADSDFVDGQSPSVVISIKPGTMKLNTNATLTIPNPDKLTDNSILHYLPDKHIWVKVASLDGTPYDQTIQVSEGGIYGIFYTDPDKNKFKLVQGYTTNPNSFVFIGDKVVESNDRGYFSAKVYQQDIVKAYVYDPTTQTVSEISVDTNGGSDKPVDAFVADMSLSSDPGSIHADGKSSSVITALLRNHNNNPVVGVDVVFQTTDGTIQYMATTDQNGRASVSLFSSEVAHDVTVSAKYSTYQDSIFVKFVEPPSAAPDSISIDLSQSVIQTISQSAFPNSAIITAHIIDANTNPIKDGTPVTFKTTLGDIDNSTDDLQTSVTAFTNKGKAVATLTSYDKTVGIATITVTAGTVTKETQITIAPGPVHEIRFSTTQFNLTADDTTQITLTALVSDENENLAIDGETITFLLDKTMEYPGSLSSKSASTENGTASVIYKAGPQSGTITVTAIASKKAITSSNNIIITLTDAPINKINLTTDELTLEPNGSCVVTAQIFNNNNGLINYDKKISFSTTRGDIDDENNPRDGVQQRIDIMSHNGIAKARLTSPSNIQGLATVTAEVDEKSDSVDVQFVPGQVASIRLSAVPETINGDGKSQSVISATVTDKNGNLVLDGEPIHFYSSDGPVDMTASTLNGIATFTYHSTIGAKNIAVTARSDNGITRLVNIYQTATLPKYMSLSVSQVTVKSDNSEQSEIIAIIKDENNTVVSGIPIVFSADGGQLLKSLDLTDEQGQASTVFSSGTFDKTNRTINITAEVEGGTLKRNIQLEIVGSSVNLTCDNSIITKDGNVTSTLIATALDAGNIPVFEVPLSFALQKSSGGTDDIMLEINGTSYSETQLNDLAVNTNNLGQVKIIVSGKKGTQSGPIDVQLEVKGLNHSAFQQFQLQETGYTVSFVKPEESRITYMVDAEPIQLSVAASSGYTLIFSTSLGFFSNGSKIQEITCDTSGIASTTYTASVAGLASIQVYDQKNPSISASLKIAVVQPPEKAAQLTLQADPKVIGLSTDTIKDQSEIIAKVLTSEATGSQVVGNATVIFSIENPTGGGEFIDPVSVQTDSSGRATTKFTSGSLSSDAQGVSIIARIQHSNVPAREITIKIGGSTSSMSIGTATESKVLNPTTYATPMSIIVSDSNGNRMANTKISLSLWPIEYRTGYWQDQPDCEPIITGYFPNEDTNKNLIMDSLAEDVNNDGQLTPPASAAGNVPPIVTTDEYGVANFDLVYLKSNAVWIKNRLEASTIVHGSATTEVLNFTLPYVISDACYLDPSPFTNENAVRTLENMTFKSTSDTIIADGSSNAVLTAILLDHNEKKIVDNQKIIFSTTSGCLTSESISSVTENECHQSIEINNTMGVIQVRLFSARKIGKATVTAMAENGVNGIVGPISFVPGPPSKIIIVPEKNTLNADGESKSAIQVNVLDATNNPVADGESVSIKINRGNLDKFVGQTYDSLVTFEYTAPGSILPSETEATITVTTTNNVVETAQIKLKPFVKSIEIISDRATIQSIEPARITATVKDSKDEPMADIDVKFLATGGNIGTSADIIETIIYKKTDNNGQASVQFSPVNRLTGDAKVVVTAGTVTAETLITVAPGPVHSIVQVKATPSSIDADNQSTSEITAMVWDALGNPVADGQWIQFTPSITNAKIYPANGMVATQDGMVSLIYTASSDPGGISIAICSVSQPGICESIQINQVQAPVSSVNIMSSDAVLMAGETCAITAYLKDAGGMFIESNTMVIFQSTIGDIDPNKPGVQNAIMTKAIHGVASTIIKAPTNILGNTDISVLVDNFSGTAQTTLSIIPGPVHHIHLTASPEIIDGTNESIISATVTDIHGNLVSNGESIRFNKTGAGLLSAPGGSTVNGVATVTLSADASSGMVTLIATSESGDISDMVFVNISSVMPAKMSISTSKTSVKSDNSEQAAISVIVLDDKNFVLSGIKVSFNASGGQLKIVNDVTDENGKATAYFSSGTVDQNNHTVTIIASISNLTPVQIPVNISGSTVTLETDNTNITENSGTSPISSTLYVTVKNAGDIPIFNTPIKFEWDEAYLKITENKANGKVLKDSDILFSDVTGQCSCFVEGLKEGDDVHLRVSAVNATAEQIYKISAPGKAFSIISPETSPYQLSVDVPLTIRVMAGPAEVTTVVFSASIGAFENNENVFEKEITPGNDIVETTYQSPMAGLTTIQVYDKYRQRISDALKVAVTQPTEKAGKLLLQSNALVVPLSSGGTLHSVTLKAKVLTTNNQVVGNAPVVFTILNPTGGGESISPVIAFTDDTGVADSLLTSGSLSSGSDGVQIKATIVGKPDISETIKIVIGGSVGSISIGIGTEVQDIDSTTYSLPMSILVSDANGNSVPGAVVTLGSWPTQFRTGQWGENVVFDDEGKLQTLDPPCRAYVTGTFNNEDINKNLLLDEGEDLNHDNQLTPPNSSAGNLPSTVTTDASGVANFELVYLKMNGTWIRTEISASTIVHGTETLSSVKFNLPVAVKDVCNLSPSPYAPPDDGTLSGQVERIILAATPDTLIRDGRSKSTIVAIVTDEEGYPVVDGEMIRFEITQGKGTISTTSASTSSGRASIIYTAASNAQDTTQVVLTATSSNNEVSQTVIIQLIPASIEMNAKPPNIPADGETQSLVSAVLKDGNNNPVINGEVKFSTSLGTVQASAFTNEFGKATAILVSSKQYGTATVVAEYSGYTQQINVVFEKLPGDPIPAKISLATSQISVKSDNQEQATISAIVLDKYNAVLKDINVIFRASDGQLTLSSVKTDENGQATTQFSSGAHDKTNRTVTVTAETGGLTPVQIPIVITGSSIALEADNSSITSQASGLSQISADLLINVTDAGGQGVFNTPIDLSWEGSGDIEIELKDPLDSGMIPTGDGFRIWSNVTGKASVLIKGKTAGDVYFIAGALGVEATKSFNVSTPGYAFGIISPMVETYSLVVGEPLSITVRGGEPGDYTVVYSTTSGHFENNESVIKKATHPDGLISATFISEKAGMATVQVYNEGNYQTSDSIKLAVYQPIEKAKKILLQSSSSSVPISNGGTQNSITLRATVTTDYTTNNQVVGNAPVLFSIVNPTGGGEFISPVIVYTDNSGVATTRFTSGSLGSTANGVTIEAKLLSMSEINEHIEIVIGGVAGSVAIGRGTSGDIETVGTSAYALPMSVLVADANGNRIAGAVVSLNTWPAKYHTGYWKANVVYDYSGKPYTLSPPCLPVRTSDFPNEDINENLFMDPNEDVNNDGELTPPNSAAGNLPATVITDENGLANFDLIYLKANAAWITNRIQASTYVHGTETVSSISFVLPNHIDDVCNLPNSPFVNYTGSVDSIKVTATQSYLIAGQSGIISALIKDDEGKLIADNTQVYFVASGGDINNELPGNQPTFSTVTVNGIATATLVSPLDDLSPIEVTVRAGDFSDIIYIDVVSVPPARMSLSTSKIAVNSDNSDNAVVTAIVLDANNSVLPGVNVSFHTSSGQVSVGYAATDANGKVEILFSSGNYDRSNRTATITAQAEGLTPVQIPIMVSGSTIEMISEKSNITVDSGVPGYSPITDILKIKVLDSGEKPVFGADIEISVVNDGTRKVDLQIAEGTTYTSIFANDTDKTAVIKSDVSGAAELRVVGRHSGNVVVKAKSLGAIATTDYKVSEDGDEFGIIYPETEIHSAFVNDPLMLTVQAGTSGVSTVVFSTTSGFFDISQNNVVDVSVINGKATATLESDVAGLATIQVYDKNNYQTSDSIKIAFSQPKDKADKILLQSSASSLPVSLGSIENTINLKATVLTDYTSGRQVVENVPVLFSIENPTGGGEFISPVIVVTDSSGIASTRFTSGSLGSSADGVVIKAILINKPDIEESIKVVIGGVAGSVAIGRGSSLDLVTLNPSTYALPMSVLVSDANGNRMANAQVSLSVWPVKYSTGYWGSDPFQGTSSYILCSPNILGTYDNEDDNENIYLDPGEDINGDGELTPPNASAGNLPSSVTTDENGVANFNLVYLKSSAVWITNRIRATTYVHGTETRSSVTFTLPYMTAESCEMPNAPYVNLTGSVKELSLSSDREYLVAGSSCDVAVTVFDDEDKPIRSNIPVTFQSTGGDIDPDIPGVQSKKVMVTNNGQTQIQLSSPTNIVGLVTITAEASGITASTEIEIIPGDMNAINLSAIPNNLTADGESTSQIVAMVTDQYGNPVIDGELITFEKTGNGILSDNSATTKDGKVELTYQAASVSGSVTIRAVSATYTHIFDEIVVPLIRAEVGMVAIESDSYILNAFGSAPAAPDSYSAILSVTVKKENNELVEDGTLVTIETDMGDLDHINNPVNGIQGKLMAATLNGIAQVVITSPRNLIGEAEIVATSGGKSASARIAIVPGPVSNIAITATPEYMTADGKSQSQIKAMVTDLNGNPVVNGETIVFEIINGSGMMGTTGKIGAAATIDGIAEIIYTSASTPGTITISATSASSNVSGTVILSLTKIGEAAISVESSKAYLVADGSNCILTAILTNTSGQYVPDGTFINFVTTIGDLDSQDNPLTGVQNEIRVATVNGHASVVLTSPTNMVGTAKITVSSGELSKEIDFSIVPGPANWIQLSATPNNLNADGISTSIVKAIVTDIHGNKVINGETINFALKNNNGRLSADTGSTIDGETIVVYTSGYTEGKASIEAWSNAYSQVRQSLDIVLIDSGIKVDSILLESEKDAIVADASSCEIIATVRDDSGNIVEDGARVTFTTTLGDLDPYTQNIAGVQKSIIAETVDGQARIRLISPTNILGKAEIIATIGGVSQIISIDIIPGMPENIVMTAAPNNLFADGLSTSVINAFISDAYGNTIVDGETITFTLTGSGRFATTGYTKATASTLGGKASVKYIAGTVTGIETIVATANANGITQSIPVTLINGDIEIDSVILHASKTILTAGGYTCVIEATVKDQDGNFINGTMVTFTTTIGDIDNSQSGTQQIISKATSSGQASVVLTTPTNILGTATVAVTVGGKSAEEKIEIVPGPVGQINLSVTSDPDELTNTAISEKTIKAKVMDRNGNNVVDGETIVFTIDILGGETTHYTRSTVKGEAEMTYYLSSSAETVTITATSTSTLVKVSKTINLSDPNVMSPHDMSISSSKQSVQSSNTDEATITAIVLDKNYAALSGITVNFSANGGLLSLGSTMTGIDGRATVSFSSGALDRRNRIVTITATVEGLVRTIPIQIIGSTVKLNCDKTSLTDDGNLFASCTAIAKDAANNSIYNTPISFMTDMASDGNPSSAILVSVLNETGSTNYTITSGSTGVYSATSGNPGPYTAMTNIEGKVNLKIYGIIDKIGLSNLLVQGLGDSSEQEFIINRPANAFGIIETNPSASNTGIVELSVDSWMGITVNAGTSTADPVTIVFSTSVGQFGNGASIARIQVAQAGGTAFTQLRSSVSGLASIQIYREDNKHISDSLSVAISHSPDKAGQLLLQSEANFIPMSKNGVIHTVELKATVLTAASSGSQVVGNAPVVFSLVNPVGGGEFLSPVVVYTDSSGIARSTFTSGSIGSDSKGLSITATLVDNSSISGHVNMIIGGTPGSISIGMGKKATSLNETTYSLPVSVLVSDANGSNISAIAVSLNIWPEKYSTGYFQDNSGCDVVFTGTFPNEDINQNLILDAGEDLDNNGKLTPASSASGNVPSIVYTDSNGVATFNLVYLKSAMWITAKLSASTVVQGTEAMAVMSFRLPYEDSDSCDLPDSPYLASSNDIASIHLTPDAGTQVAAGGISCNNGSIDCNERWVFIEANLQDNSGNLVRDGMPVVFKTTAGSLTDSNALTSNSTPAIAGVRKYTATTNGGYARVKLFSSDKLGKAVVSAESGYVKVNTVIEFIAGPASQILINPKPVSLPADGESQSEILITVLDATGNPVADNEAVNVSVDHGVLNRRVDYTQNGFVTFIYTSPSSLPNNEVDNIYAVVSNGEDANETINLTGPPISGIDLSIEPESLPMDGQSKATVFATVSLSGGGNVPDGTTVNFSIVGWTAEKGSIEENGLTASGIARAILTSGTTSDPVTIRAEAGGRTAELIIRYTQGSMNVSIVPNSILGNGKSYASVMAVPRDVTGNVKENAVVLFQINNTAMGGFVEYTTVTNDMLSSGGVSQFTSLVISGEAKSIFIGANIGDTVRITSIWDQNQNGIFDTNEVSGYATLDIQPPPSFIIIGENSPDPSSINIKGTGGVSTSQIEFEVKDSRGQMVSDGYKILFSINSGPDGGEDIQPAFAYTKDGKVSTILRSGFKSGPVSIKAVYYNDTSISTNTSQVAINAGPPVGEEFGISAKYSNISGLYNAFLENEISINAGDVYGNMIPDNTVISFKTYNTGGLFQPNIAVTQNGIASNVLISTGTNPEPLQGFVYLTAEANNGGRTTHITCMKVSPGNNNIIYAGTNGGGVYKSIDSGGEWVNISRSSEYAGQNMIDPYINDIEIDPGNANNVYAATGYLGRGNVYRSLDGGLNWNSNNTEEWNGLLWGMNSAVQSVLCDDYSGGYTKFIWIGTDGQGILFSKDGGDTFLELGDTTPEGDTVLLSESDAYSNPNNRGNGYLRRPNLSCSTKGQTWSFQYVVSYKSRDNNSQATFSETVEIQDNVSPESWTARKIDNDHWGLTNSSGTESYTATLDENRVAEFDQTTPLSFTVYENSLITSSIGENCVFHLAGQWDVYGSISGKQGLPASDNLYYHTDNEEIEIIIISGSIPFGHNDRFSFTAESGGLGCGKSVHDIVKVPGTHGLTAELFAATSTGIYKSVNGGRVWEATKNFEGDNIATLEIYRVREASNDIVIIAGTKDAGVYYSYDSGADWIQHNDGLGYGLNTTTPEAYFENIGNGTVVATLPDDTSNTRTETWFLECVSEEQNGGKFSVTGSSSGVRLTATVGEISEYTEMVLYIIDGEKDFQLGDKFTFRTIRDSSMEIKDLLFYNDFANSQSRLYALTYFWGVQEPHAVGSVYSVDIQSYVPSGSWSRVNEVSGLPTYEPPGDISLFAQHVIALDSSDDYKALENRTTPTRMFIGGEGINFYATDNFSNLATGKLNWQESKIGLSNLIMARRPVLFSDTCQMTVKEQILWGNPDTVAYFLYEIYVQDKNGNPPIQGSLLTYSTYKVSDGEYKLLDTDITICDYPDTMIASGTYRDKSDPETNNPFRLYFMMGQQSTVRGVEFTFTPAKTTGATGIIAPGSSGSKQKTPRYEY